MGREKLGIIAVQGVGRCNLGTLLSRLFSDSSTIWGRRSLKTFFNDRGRRPADKELDMKIGMRLMTAYASQQLHAPDIRAVIKGRAELDVNSPEPLLSLRQAIRGGYKPGGFLLDFLECKEAEEKRPRVAPPDDSEKWARLEARNEAAKQHPLPSIRLIKTTEPGFSKLGGLPYLPESVQWPRNPQKTELTLLAQIHCPDLPPGLGLPETGTLFFFYDFEEKESHGYRDFCRVIHTEEPLPGTPRGRTTPAISMGNALNWDIRDENTPETESSCFQDVFLAFETFESQVTDSEVDEDAEDTAYRMLGYPQWCQNEYLWEDDETLLLQLASDSDDDGPHWTWADSGKIYVWIKADALAARDFSHVRVTLDW